MAHATAEPAASGQVQGRAHAAPAGPTLAGPMPAHTAPAGPTRAGATRAEPGPAERARAEPAPAERARAEPAPAEPTPAEALGGPPPVPAVRRRLTPAMLAVLQRAAGNAAVGTLVGDPGPAARAPQPVTATPHAAAAVPQGASGAVQRQPAPAPAPAPGVAAPLGPAPAALPDFGNTTFGFAGRRFDLDYRPVGPSPAVGKVTVTLKVHVIFKPFERAMMRRKEFVRHRWTREQLNDFAWPETEQESWVGRFRRAVSDGWKEKHAFVLDTPGFAPHRATCDVQVTHVDTPADANTVITAQWVPRGAPRLRSSVTGSAAELDARDVDQPETHRVRPAQLIRQIQGFDHDSAEITPAVEAGIVDFEQRFRRLREPGRAFAGVAMDDIHVGLSGRATSPGSQRYNTDLGLRRASAVMDRLMDDLGLTMPIAIGTGETNATDDPKFRRVDATATVGAERDVTQNVAAHEAGHMFGLGDEYVEERPPAGVLPKFAGDEPTHSADVRAALGDEAAEQLLVQNGPSIMSQGSEVLPGHYVPFLEVLDRITSKSWTLE